MGATPDKGGSRTATGRKVPDVLAGAKQVFLERGYAGTSMDEVAAAAQVSKRTLYQYFPSKEALFAAVVQSRVADSNQLLEEQVQRTQDEPASLLELAQTLLERVMTDDVSRLYRMVLPEVNRLPELGEALLKVGLTATLAEIESILVRIAKARGVTLEDPAFAAEIFLSLFYGVDQIRVLLGVPAEAVRARLFSTLAERIAAFERGFGLAAQEQTTRGLRKAD